MTSGIYDFRDNEIEAVRRIRKERIVNAVEAAISAPFLLAAIFALFAL